VSVIKTDALSFFVMLRGMRDMSEAAITKSELLTKREAAEIMRVSEISVHRLITCGKLASYNIGRRVFTTRRFIDDFLQRNEKSLPA
jgi:excisionase family DNA binding protein